MITDTEKSEETDELTKEQQQSLLEFVFEDDDDEPLDKLDNEN